MQAAARPGACCCRRWGCTALRPCLQAPEAQPDAHLLQPQQQEPLGVRLLKVRVAAATTPLVVAW